MRYVILLLCAVLTIGVLLWGIAPRVFSYGTKDASFHTPQVFELIDSPEETLERQPPFSRGEQFVYTLNYKSLPLGSSTLTFEGERDLHGTPAYFITFTTQMPTIKDAEHIYADKETFLPLQVNRHIQKIAQFPTDITEQYDQDEFKVTIKKEGKFLSKTFTIKKETPIHNAILLTYYYRTLDPIDKDHVYHIALPTTEFKVSYEGTQEISTGIGTQEAHVFSSVPSRFKVWLSADDKRVPLRIENEGAMGYSLVLDSIVEETPAP
ncbi:MAG: DUF3108 domain-containing protein [Candidatus Omnitrophica bacterium]|nr:DUF3108 domain-containing protein [Candidatus Omnitrophota bacterium]